MAAVLNELIEEAIARTLELAEQADQTAQAIGSVAGQARSLAQKVASEAEEAHRHFQELGTRLDAAEAELEAAGGSAADELDGLVRQAGEVKVRVDSLLEKVRQGAAELEAEKARISAALEERAELTDADFEKLGTRLREVQAAARQHLQTAQGAIRQFSEAVVQAAQRGQEAQGRLIAAMDDLSDFARVRTVEYVEAVDEGLDATSDLRMELANRLVEEHNQAVVALRETVAERAVDDVAQSIQPLRDAIEVLAQVCEGHEEALMSKSALILEKVDEALQAAARIQPVLEMAQRLV